MDSNKINDKANMLKKNKKYTQPKLKKVHETAGLEQTLTVGIGSRIILKRNIDMAKGLVNGALGTIEKCIFYTDKTTVAKIVIKFDHQPKVYELERISADVAKHYEPFPVSHFACMGYYHKCQGLSLKAVLLDIGNNIFQGGMAYVALSRAFKLENIYIAAFNPRS